MTIRADRAETGVQTVILLAVAGMAGAASFTHVHDWTMHNSPPGTGDWFGWANAMVSELIPLAAGLEVRRLRRNGYPVGVYPIALVLAAVALSLAGQFAEAKPGPSGWLISAVPALGFLALVKLVLSRPTTPTAAEPATDAEPTAAADETRAGPTTAPAVDVDTPPTADVAPYRQTVAAELLPGARIIATSHRQATGQPITPVLLAERMNLPADTADRILAALGEHTDRPTVTTAHNGHPYAGGR
jgi:hypothetical protein